MRFTYRHHPHLSRRPATPATTSTVADDTLNARLARRGTLIFGSMPAFYAFMIYGALGAIFTGAQATLLYWSNWIQLWSLPLLMVGAVVLGKASDIRAAQTYADTTATLHEIAQTQQHLHAQDDQITWMTAALQALANAQGVQLPVQPRP